MNERLTLQDLIDILSQKQGMTKKDAETFLRELIAVISENIETLDPVKIKDFGTFKLVKVNARKSVDVNTGEAIEIPAHYKLSFAPDKSLKEAVNKPFAHFESVVLEDGVSFDNLESSEIPEDAEEELEEEVTESIAPIASVIPIEDKEEAEDSISLAESEVLEEKILEDSNVEEYTDIIDEVELPKGTISTESDELEITPEELLEDKQVEEENVEESATPSEKEESVVATKEIVVKVDETESQKMFERHKRKTQRRRFISMSFIAFLIIGAFALGGLYFQEIMKGFSGQLQESDIVVKTEDRKDNSTPLVKNEETDSALAEKQDSIKEIAKTPVIIKDTIKSGKTLRLISLKHYGHRSFWPYIYDENRDVIKNPNSVPIDTELIIPAPEKYGIDAQNKESIEKAKEMESKLIKEFNL